MISVITVFNNKSYFKNILLPSLQIQKSKYQLIPFDNRNNFFKSAASALNYLALKAKGKYLMFVHQDVELIGKDWLKATEKILDSIPDLGVAGVAGMTLSGITGKEKARGSIFERGSLWAWNNPVSRPTPVQTLDECLIIVPKNIFLQIPFDDKTFNGWHYYASDYCLTVKNNKLESYVIPQTISHRSPATNTKGIFKYQLRLFFKHRKQFNKISTTCGQITALSLFYRFVREIFRPIYRILFPEWTAYLKNELRGCHTVLDVGCGSNSPIQYCKIETSLGVDIDPNALIESKKRNIHSKYININIRKITFPINSFEAVLCSEVLEHLDKKSGLKLINKMIEWASRKVILTTPNGFLIQSKFSDNPYQKHLSGWKSEELKKIGFRVKGINGLRFLHGEKGIIKYKPRIFWHLFSQVGSLIAFWIPKIAFQLFAVYNINKNNMNRKLKGTDTIA